MPLENVERDGWFLTLETRVASSDDLPTTYIARLGVSDVAGDDDQLSEIEIHVEGGRREETIRAAVAAAHAYIPDVSDTYYDKEQPS